MKLRDLSLSALFILEAVERSGTMSKAAAQEDVSRARVTQALQRLELQLGFAMLTTGRVKKRMLVLTSGARDLAAIARRFRHALQNELDSMDTRAGFGRSLAKSSGYGAGAAKIRNISLTSLCTLESVGRSGGLSEAAVEEGLTVAGAGQAIARLEQHLGPLVERAEEDSRRRVLTKKGQRIALITREYRTELQRVLNSHAGPSLSK